jgi:hypothetical protein
MKRRSIARLFSVSEESDDAPGGKKMKVLAEKLRIAGINTASDLFQSSVIDLMLSCDLSLEDVDVLKSSIARNILISKHLGEPDRCHQTIGLVFLMTAVIYRAGVRHLSTASSKEESYAQISFHGKSKLGR